MALVREASMNALRTYIKPPGPSTLAAGNALWRRTLLV